MIYAIFIAGLILRLISLNQSLWLDEATSALAAKMPLGDIFARFLPGDFHPPLYYLLLKLWASVFGFSEISLRMPSVILGVATVYIVCKISKNYYAPLLLATSGLAIYYSQEARMYSLAAFLVGLLVYLYLQKKWLLFSVTLLLLGMTDYVSLLIIPVFWTCGRKFWKKLALSHLPLVFGFVIWSPIFVRQLSQGISLKGSGWWTLLGTATFKNIALIPVKFMFGRISFDNKLLYGVLAVMALCLFGYLLYKAKNAPKILWAWLTVPVALGILISFKIPTLSYFRFLFCLPALYLLIARSKASKYLIYSVVVINLLTSGYYLFNPRFYREDWRGAAGVVGSTKIVFPADSQKEALIYYGKGGQIISVNALSGVEGEFWLSRYVAGIFDPADTVRKKIEDLGYNKASEYNFNGVVFWKYTKK